MGLTRCVATWLSDRAWRFVSILPTGPSMEKLLARFGIGSNTTRSSQTGYSPFTTISRPQKGPKTCANTPSPRAANESPSTQRKAKVITLNSEGHIVGLPWGQTLYGSYKAFIRNNDPCTYCGKLPVSGTLAKGQKHIHTFDHVFPVSKGGRDRNNMTVACYGCNHRKGSLLPLHFLLEIRHKQIGQALEGCLCRTCAGDRRAAEHKSRNLEKREQARLAKLAQIQRTYDAVMETMYEPPYERHAK